MMRRTLLSVEMERTLSSLNGDNVTKNLNLSFCFPVVVDQVTLTKPTENKTVE